MEYLKYQKKIQTEVRQIPKMVNSKRSQLLGCIIEDVLEVDIFRNSLAHASKAGIPTSKFWVFTTSKSVESKISRIRGISMLFLESLTGVGLEGLANVGARLRRHFLQAWLSFVVADAGVRMLWQSPGTIWRGKPDYVVNDFASPAVETIWAFKGRKDKRSAPFFNSFDFFVPGVDERAVHLMHEMLLHFDLVLAWGSLDTACAYRLAENVARYGTTSYLFPPIIVLHTDVINNDPIRLKEAVDSKQSPKAIVVPSEGLSANDARKLIQDSGLWILET